MQTEPGVPSNNPGELSLSARLMLFALAIFLLDNVCMVIGDMALRSLHFFEWYYGAEQVEVAGGGEVMHTRMTLWIAAVAFPLWVGCVAFLILRLKAVSSADIGLTLRAGGRNLLRGCAAAMVLTPPVLWLNFGVTRLFEAVLGFAPIEHPLSAAGKQGLLPAEWVLVAFLVMVSAPVREELLFRGVLQRLFAEHTWASHVAMGLALLTAVISSILAVTRQKWSAGPPPDGLSLLSAFMPALFIVTMAPAYLVVWLRSKTSHAPAVFATALFFAATHSFAWPTPIALFVLGLGLGYLALRTRSLVAPVVVHCLFNGVSLILLVTSRSI